MNKKSIYLEQRHLLPWVAAVMVYAQRHRGHRLALPFSDRGLLSPQHRPAVTRVGADDLVGPYHQHHPARADLGHVREALQRWREGSVVGSEGMIVMTVVAVALFLLCPPSHSSPSSLTFPSLPLPSLPILSLPHVVSDWVTE